MASPLLTDSYRLALAEFINILPLQVHIDDEVGYSTNIIYEGMRKTENIVYNSDAAYVRVSLFVQ